MVWLDEELALLTPLDRLPWWSERFFLQLSIAGATEARYLDWDGAAGRNLGATNVKSDPLRWPQLWVGEVPHGYGNEWEAVANALAESAELTIRHTKLLEVEEAVEEHFVLPVRVDAPSPKRFSPRAIWRELLDAGQTIDSDPDGPSLLLDPSAEEIDELWKLYSETMSVLSTGHPIESTLDRSEFERFIDHQDDCVLVLRSGGEPIALALLNTDLARFEWLDQRWYREILPQPTSPALVMIPGIVTKLDRQSLGLIHTLLMLIPRMIEHSRSEVTVTFPCNNLSRQYTPAIAQRGLDPFKPVLKGAVERIATYQFRAAIVG